MKNNLTKRITITAILAGISTLLYLYLKFPLPFFPSFLDIQFSNLPVIIAGFAFGPIEAIAVVVVRFLIKLPMTSTAGIGEIADLIIGLSVAISTSLIYHKNHSRKGGIVALGIGTLVWVVVASFVNYFVLLPWFAEAYGIGAVVGMLSSVIKGITTDNYLIYYVLFGAIPFNLLLSTIVSVITFIVYKRISFLFKSEDESTKIDSGIFVGASIMVMTLIILAGNLIFKFSAFVVSAKNSLASVIITIAAYSLIFLTGFGILFVSIIKRKQNKDYTIE